MPELSLFLPLTKVDAANRLVYGVATAESLDRSGEVCDYASTKPFYEKWSGGIAKATDGKSLGNLRAMHGKIAAGKVTAIAFNDAAKQIEVCAKVVDDAEWRKVEEGVYTGFSQGGAYARRWTDEAGVMRYTADPSEISLVDLPCLPSATFQVLKADGASETRPFAAIRHIAVPPPSNGAVAREAADLAQAAGREDRVGDFVEAARAALVEAAEAEALAKARPAAPPPVDPASAEGSVEQVWKARDGTTFAKKAEALAHNATAAAMAAAQASAAPVLEALAHLGKTLDATESKAAAEAPPRATPRRKPHPAAAAEVIDAEALAKDLYGVSRLATLLSDIKGMTHAAAFDVVYQGDDPALPGRMKAWAGQGIALLQAMVTAEMADLMGDAPSDAALALAAAPLSDEAFGALLKAVPPDSEGGQALTKIGARNSRADRERIQRMHDDARGLGAICGGADKAADGDLAKVTAALDASTQALATATGERDALRKTLTDQVLPEIARLAKLIGDQPVPRHLVGRAVTKGAEAADREAAGTETAEALLARMDPEARATLLIKLAQQKPQPLTLAR